MKMRALKYLLVYTLPLSVFLSFIREGWQTFMPVIYGFVIVPLLELLLGSDPSNLERAEQDMVKKDVVYDILVWLIVPVQCGFLAWYLFNIQTVEFLGLSWWGRTISMGMMCGVLGINVAHELGHRRNKLEQLLSKILLMTSLYPHFFIEHNYGHHKHVATHEDPASARLNEPLYLFWVRSIVFSYLSAWKIEHARLRRKRQSRLSWHNEMLIFTIIEILSLAIIAWLFGPAVLLGFVMAAISGVLLLETVNYIEHYGLRRQKVSESRYEQTSPVHSWNSDHLIGRMFLFELSRHSDHHAYPHKKYQVLQSYEESPQMPTGYPGMMVLSTIPPLWFWIMNHRIRGISENCNYGKNTLVGKQEI